MDHDFWTSRWTERKISFHEGEPNALLVKHFARLDLKPGSRIFVPLCGKSRDLGWLLAHGHRVVGIELSEIAVTELFEELGVSPAIEPIGDFTCYAHGSIAVFVGDFFKLTDAHLGPVDAVYDRAALVALPDAMRRDYAPHLIDLTAAAPQLLVSFDYDQATMEGPPFSVPGAEIERMYGDRYVVELLESAPISGRLAQKCSGAEETWLLSPK